VHTVKILCNKQGDGPFWTVPNQPTKSCRLAVPYYFNSIILSVTTFSPAVNL